MDSDAIIKFEAVSKHYQMGEVTVTALDKMDLEIEAGEFVILLRPSGCGKTTALNLAWIIHRRPGRAANSVHRGRPG